ncbi:MAG TPA: phosphatidylglycerol lysyltransferase domain-containing protein [Gaiellaceae bacterium]|nr:phosphatidylglycerol lysyltransferase domain-containing protein [Gaiellaceae bacterium]
MLRVERHRLGLRVYLFRRRIHEWHLGLAVLTADALAGLLGALAPVPSLVIALVGVWLVAKDWPDLTPSGRDATAWRLGLHRRPLRLRPSRRLDDVPAVAAVGVAVVAIVDLISAATPNVSWRGHVLVDLEPIAVMRGAHALAVPVSFALLITAYYLYRRRSRALRIAFVLMAALTVVNLVKGLDVEEAGVTAAAAALLWASRSSFYVRHEPATLRSAVWRLPLLLAGVFLASLAAVAFAAPASASAADIVRATGDLLLWQRAPFAFHDELARTGLAIELTGLLALLVGAYVVFRPLAAPRDLPDPELRRAAAELVREHGADTLSFFKLRADKQYLFNPDKTAFVGYRIEGRVLMISGDPIGEQNDVENLLPVLVQFAEEHALRLAALGVSPEARALFEQAGLRALYMGDEAIVDTERFSLEGRPIRKVRQSVSRLRKAGYRTAVSELGSLDAAVVSRLEQVAADWRRGAPERGFSMAMDSLRNPHGEKTLVVYASDDRGVIRGFLHFVPTYGRDAVSLSFMRRQHETPNGLTEFLIVEAIEHLRARGISEVSLNFSAFGRFIRKPSGLVEKTLGRVLVLGDTWFQIERLYRFNAKFFPRWEPRYFMYERRFGLPRAGIAALWLEGQLPKPKIRGRHGTARV